MQADMETGLALELRVLHGAQAGSRMPIEAGEYLLGSDDICSVILVGPRIAGQHAALDFDGEQLFLQPIDGEVADAQGNPVLEEMTLEIGFPVELGSVWIVVDAVDAPWPAPGSVGPMPPVRSKEAVPADDSAGTPAGVEQADAATAADPLAADADLLGDDADGATRLEDQPARRGWSARLASVWSRGAVRHHSRRLLLVVLGCLGLIGVLGACAFVLMGSGGESVAAPAAAVEDSAPKKPPAALAELVARRGAQGRLTLRHEAGEWLLQGYVQDANARAALMEELKGIDARTQVTLIEEEELVQAANKLLAPRNSGGSVMLRAENTGAGGLRVTGAATSGEAAAAAVDAVRSALPGVLKVELNVLYPAELRTRLKSQLAAAGLEQRMSIIAQEPELVLAGTLSPEETQRWENLLVEFTRQYGNVLPLRASIGRVRPPMPVNVQVIVGGRTPYIVTETGERVNAGGDINGHTLTSVRDAEVVFEGNKRVRVAR